MHKLDDLIPGSPMTYRERLELCIGDKRGNYSLSPELMEVNGAIDYAKNRINVWQNWNSEYEKLHKNSNTQERYIKAQAFSKPYAIAVYKSIVLLISSQILQCKANEVNDVYSILQTLLWTYMEASIFIMKSPSIALLQIIKEVKSKNTNLGFVLELKFKNYDDKAIKSWVNAA